jgi:DNA (cytosine-5)-methyltransferase 1
MKICNLYAGLGGNRKLWPEDVEVTAVEYNPEIAAIYKEYFPKDTVIVGDAHEYLLQNYKEFDFIWSSPPCQTHSRARQWTSKGGRYPAKYPDMKLWQEIIFLQGFADCKWAVENVIPYYDVFIPATIEIDRHLVWSNFPVRPIEIPNDADIHSTTSNSIVYGFDLSTRKINHRKDQILRNLVNPELGLYILEQAQGIIRAEKTNQLGLFNNEAA